MKTGRRCLGRLLIGGTASRHDWGSAPVAVAIWLSATSVGWAWQPLIVHPVKDEATLAMLRMATGERDRVVREMAEEALALIADPNVTNRVSRLPALDHAGWSDADVLRHLNADEAWQREIAVREAGRRKLPDAEPALVALLEHSDERLRRAAAAALGQLRRGGAAALRRLEVEPSRRAREALVGLLLAVRDEASREGLVNLLRHPRWETREAAVWALRDWGDRELALVLTPLLRDRHLSVQTVATEALTHLRHPGTERALLDALDQVDPAVQPAVVRALGELRSVTAIPRLAEWVTSTNNALATATVEALGKIPDQRVPALLKRPIEQISNQQFTVRPVAIRYLRERGVSGLEKRMAQIVADRVVPPPPLIPEPGYDTVEARQEALRYLQRFGQREHAEYILGRMEAQPPPALRPLLAETISQLTGQRYEPVPDEDYRRYFVESLTVWDRTVPRGGIRLVTAQE
ncbi:MAG: HEAT repeat domain-containing protein [Verrucomicrobiae bacterium]|nr:HEAT repeat domain-containing protein [Verrucomicrobiae bacterium]